MLEQGARAFADRRWSVAAQLFAGVLAADDDSRAYRWELALALFNARRHREAIAAFEHALQLGVGSPAVGAWHVARAYARRGNRKQALRWLSHATALGFDASQALRDEPSFEPYRNDPRFGARSDSIGRARGSGCRYSAGTGDAPVREVGTAQLGAMHPLHARDDAVGARAAIDDPLREVVRRILEADLIAVGTKGAEFGGHLPGGCRREHQGIAARVDAHVLELDDGIAPRGAAHAEHHAAARREPLLLHEAETRTPLPAARQPRGRGHTRGRLRRRVIGNAHGERDRGAEHVRGATVHGAS
jgi:tetratricopeptide (TPR) repeat protein